MATGTATTIRMATVTVKAAEPTHLKTAVGRQGLNHQIR